MVNSDEAERRVGVTAMERKGGIVKKAVNSEQFLTNDYSLFTND
jgi:hypothetical protein